ncbi:ribosomal L28 family-domain-containing protein [Podospora appendiculata]|uniref:Large ribosomal subunit protein bL28m n=1 Tax=Podospora appendiculata TaxID=314037 RepID=A0AAE1C8N7_9PEZI|nr:ribosomal L28 family-domain-containing protein [Podospora appendiculata]
MSPTLLPSLRRQTTTLLTTTTTTTSCRPSSVRALSTTSPLFYNQPRVPSSAIPIPSVSGRTNVPALEIPAYPYGPHRIYHQSNTGLYGSAKIRFGNKVSSRNEIKTRRKWRPNVHTKRLWSDALGVFVRTRVTTRVLRTVDKAGGLDAYLLGGKPGRVKELGPWGWMLRWRVMLSPAVQARFAAERAALGLPPVERDLFAEVEEGLAREGLRKVAADAQKQGSSKKGSGDAAAVVTAQDLMAETSRMLAEEQEFLIGEESEFAAEAQAEAEDALDQQQQQQGDGFMKEEKPNSTTV